MNKPEKRSSSGLLLIIMVIALLIILVAFFVYQKQKETLPKKDLPNEELRADTKPIPNLPETETPLQTAVRQTNPEKCPDGFLDDAEQKDPNLCPEDRQNATVRVGQNPSRQTQPQQQPQAEQPKRDIMITATGSKYKVVSEKPSSGWFKTVQDADLMLSGIDFNNAGGPLLFNHPGEMATNGPRLFLADRNNNRVLVWNKIPSGNVAPDMVLGQKDFNTNNPGSGKDQMNWPVGLSAANGKLVVADANNQRILIWNSMPTQNAQPADIIIEKPGNHEIKWPWGAWTDGKKLAVSSTQTSSVLIWNSFPTSSDQAPDIILTAAGKMGTPRGITSNGEYLIVADHNAKINDQGSTSATFFWKNWPSSDKPADFTLPGWRTGTFTPDNQLVLLSTTHFPPSIWKQAPTSGEDEPDLQLTQAQGTATIETGDGSDILWAENKLYLSLSNGNKIIAFNSIPEEPTQKADFAIGSPDIGTNTLETNYFMTNPIVATDGKSLIASSDFDRRMYVWQSLPDESGAHPDFVYELEDTCWSEDNTIWKDTLVIGGRKSFCIWNKIPANGEKPDSIFDSKIGSVNIEDVSGIALDDKYFYLATTDKALKGKLYVWEGLPKAESEPRFILSFEGIGQIESDGKYLTGIFEGRNVGIIDVEKLSDSSKPTFISGKFNLPRSAIVKNGHLFVADTGFGRVQVWTNVKDALEGKQADVVLGENDFEDTQQEIGKNKLFWPATLAFDGSYLWVGEFKFSGRILRYSIS